MRSAGQYFRATLGFCGVFLPCLLVITLLFGCDEPPTSALSVRSDRNDQPRVVTAEHIAEWFTEVAGQDAAVRGTDAHILRREWIQSQLNKLEWDARWETYPTIGESAKAGVIRARPAGAKGKARALLVTHWDIKKISDQSVGANDGVSGLVTLLTVAQAQPLPELELVFLGAEHPLGPRYTNTDGLNSSKALSRALAELPDEQRPEFALYVEMSGSGEGPWVVSSQIASAGFSTTASLPQGYTDLAARLLAASGKERGLTLSQDPFGGAHVALQLIGRIPAAIITEPEYRKEHTPLDVVDALDQELILERSLRLGHFIEEWLNTEPAQVD